MKKAKNLVRVFVSVLFIQVLFWGTSFAQEHGGEGEEDGTQLKKSQTYDGTKYGVRLVLKYNDAKKAFLGTVENKSKKSS